MLKLEFLEFIFNWTMIALQCCVGFCHTKCESAISIQISGLPWWLSEGMRLPEQETQIWLLGWEDPLEREMTTHSSIPAWTTPWTEEPGGLQSIGSQESDMTEATEHTHTTIRNVIFQLSQVLPILYLEKNILLRTKMMRFNMIWRNWLFDKEII